MKQIAAGVVEDQRRGVHRLRPAVEPRIQQLGAQCRGADRVEVVPLGSCDLRILQNELGMLPDQVEGEPYVVVPVRRFSCVRAGLDVVEVNVDRDSEKLRGEAQIACLDPGLLAHLAHRRGEQRAIPRLGMTAGDEDQAARPVKGVQHTPILVDHHGTARDVRGHPCAARRFLRPFEQRQQGLHRDVFGGMALEVYLHESADVGSGGWHVSTSCGSGNRYGRV